MRANGLLDTIGRKSEDGYLAKGLGRRPGAQRGAPGRLAVRGESDNAAERPTLRREARAIGACRHGFRAQRRTYHVVDRAGNTLRLTDIDLKGKDDADATVTSLQYNGGPVRIPFLNTITADWTLAKNGTFKTLDQTLAVLWPIQAATSTWRSSDNKTRIVSLDLRGLHTYTTPGMFLMRLATNTGSLSVEANPAG